jgi:hypothetical protein
LTSSAAWRICPLASGRAELARRINCRALAAAQELLEHVEQQVVLSPLK